MVRCFLSGMVELLNNNSACNATAESHGGDLGDRGDIGHCGDLGDRGDLDHRA
jgi:hypothetical protein